MKFNVKRKVISISYKKKQSNVEIKQNKSYINIVKIFESELLCWKLYKVSIKKRNLIWKLKYICFYATVIVISLKAEMR